jgi:hypothetical protein
MSVSDRIRIIWDIEDRWLLMQGRETFYDENRNIRSWPTRDEARAWALANLGKDPDDYYKPQAASPKQREMFK